MILRKPFINRTAIRRGVGRREVVIVACIVGIGILLLLTYLNQQRALARRNMCEFRQMRQAQALWVHESLHGAMPGYRNLQSLDAEGQPVPASWVFATLPYIAPPPPNTDLEAQEKWFAEYLKGETGEAKPGPYAPIHDEYGPQGPDKLRGQTPQLYVPELVCPSHPPDESDHAGWLCYVVNSGLPDAPATEEAPADWPANGMFLDLFPTPDELASPVTLQFVEEHDGLNHTLLLTENVDCGRWTESRESLVGFVWVANVIEGQAAPGDQLLRINQRAGEGDGSIKFARPSSYHPGGVNVVYASGATRFLTDEMDYLVFAQLMSSDGRDIRQPGALTPIGAPYRIEPSLKPQDNAPHGERQENGE